MQKKSLERRSTQKEDDKQARVVGDSGRQKKLMQNYFEKKDEERREEKRLRLDTSERGINWHQMSLGKYKNGAIHFNREALERMEKGDIYGGAYAKTAESAKRPGTEGSDFKIGQEKIERKKHTYEGIMKERQDNEEYMTGKRYAKSRGAMGKIHKKGQKTKKKFKKKK